MQQVDYQPIQTAEELVGAKNTAMFLLRHVVYAVSQKGDIYSANIGNPRWTPLCHGGAFHGRTYYACCSDSQNAFFHGGFNPETCEYFSDLLIFSGSKLDVLEHSTHIPVREHAMGLFTLRDQTVLVGFGGYWFDSRGARVSDATFVYFVAERRFLVISPDVDRFHEDFPNYPGQVIHSPDSSLGQTSNPSELTLEISPSTQDWPEGRYAHTITTVENRVLMFGGHNGLTPLGDLWEFCPSYGPGGLELSWRKIEPRLGADPTCSNLYSIGGGSSGLGTGATQSLQGRASSQGGSRSLGLSSLAPQRSKHYDMETELDALRIDGTPTRDFFRLRDTPGRLYQHTCVSCGKLMILVSGVGNPSGAFWVYDTSSNCWIPSRVRYPLVGFGLPLATDGTWIYSTSFRIALADIALYGGGTAMDLALGQR